MSPRPTPPPKPAPPSRPAREPRAPTHPQPSRPAPTPRPASAPPKGAHMPGEVTVRAIDDDFHPVKGPTLATVHRQWLDRGLPASSWLDYLKRWQETQAPVVTHTHVGDQCYPACRRWGAS